MCSEKHRPSRLLRLVQWLLPGYVDDTAAGDYAEVYESWQHSRGALAARLWLTAQCFQLALQAAVRGLGTGWQAVAQALKLAVRTARSHPFYTGINLLGLTVGMTVFGLMMMYVQHELSYDSHHEKADRIFRLTFSGAMGGDPFAMASVAAVTRSALLSDFPEIETAVRIQAKETPVLRHGDKSFKETGLAFADKEFFEVFTLPLVEGNAPSALAEPYTLVLSKSAAMKYFGHEEVMGQTLTSDDGHDYKITGIFDAMPRAGHFRFDILASMSSLERSSNHRWLDNMVYHTYVLLKDQSMAQALELKFPEMVKTYLADFLARFGGSTEPNGDGGTFFKYALQPIKSIHLHSSLLEEMGQNGSAQSVAVFSVVAMAVLLIACVNFMNLATARSLSRAREVGVRKSLGGSRHNLLIQFLLESMSLTGLALLLALALISALLPVFSAFSGRHLIISRLFTWQALAMIAAVWAMVSLLAGSYPALYLASLKPAMVFRQQTSAPSTARRLQNGLVLFQFLLSVVLIAGALVVRSQWHFIHHKDQGFDKSQVLVLDTGWALGSNALSFREELASLPQFAAVSLSHYVPVGDNEFVDVMSPEGRYRDDGTPIVKWHVDDAFVKTLGMQLTEGRDFDWTHDRGQYSVIVNETAVKQFGWEQALGKRIYDGLENGVRIYTVVGVVKDFHYQSLREAVAPLTLVCDDHWGFRYASIRLKPGRVEAGIEAVRKLWEKRMPGRPFAYSFLDQDFESIYMSEARETRLFMLFAGLAVFIGCLGLLGLAALSAHRRSKEIALHKICGASPAHLVVLLGRQYGGLVLLAFGLGTPVAWWLMRRWLTGFAYQTDLNWMPFAAAGLIAFAVAATTITVVTMGAALKNPVESLRVE